MIARVTEVMYIIIHVVPSSLMNEKVLKFKDYYTVDACKMVIRVSAPFTEDDYCGKREKAKYGAGS